MGVSVYITYCITKYFIVEYTAVFITMKLF